MRLIDRISPVSTLLIAAIEYIDVSNLLNSQSTKLELVVKLTPLGHLFFVAATIAMTLLYTRHAGKSKAELLDEIVRLEKELKSRNDEISMLKKKISLYKSI